MTARLAGRRRSSKIGRLFAPPPATSVSPTLRSETRMTLFFKAMTAALLMTTISGTVSAQGTGDPHEWLEDVRGEKALGWAKAESDRTLKGFQSDPRYQGLYDRALQVLQAKDPIPMVQMRPDGLYNFWQDETNVRGLLRRTTLASYRTAEPAWE